MAYGKKESPVSYERTCHHTEKQDLIHVLNPIKTSTLLILSKATTTTSPHSLLTSIHTFFTPSRMPQLQLLSAQDFISAEPASAPRRKHDIERVGLSEENTLLLPRSPNGLFINTTLLDRMRYSTERQCYTLQVFPIGGIHHRMVDSVRSEPIMLSSEPDFLRTQAASFPIDELLMDSSSQEVMEPHAVNIAELSVPDRMRYSTELLYYTPQVASIGPKHHLIIDTLQSEPDFLRTGAVSASREEWLMYPPSQRVTEPHAVSIDILSAATEEKLLLLPPLSGGCSIYTVPDRMRYSNERHYTPRMVSIGPIHYHNEKLRANEHLKERYLAEFRQHTGVSLNECYKLILDQETKLRNCYADIIELEKENFAKMVLVDAAFLLMILVYTCFRSLVSSSDKLFKKPKMMLDIIYDMLLLENQLPFFILEDLYELSKLHNILGRESNLKFGKESAMTYLGHQFCVRLRMTTIPWVQPGPNALHILDMLRSYLTPTDWTPERKESQTRNIPSMKELHQAGVKIQVGSKHNMFDIRFKHGILEVPPLVINDTAELIFRNLLAFELCHCSEHIFSDYFEMMRLLTISAEDTELLIQNRAIDNALPNAQRVSTLFQSIDSGNIIEWSKFLYSDVIKGLNDYYKLDWHKWKATLKEKYFKAPWAICSVSVAVLLLVLTIVQTVFTILQVALPK